MSWLKWICLGVLIFQVATATASANESKKILRVYGPGGPHLVLQECAELFLEKEGITVSVIKALPNDLERKLRMDGDLYYGGAEYMLEDFDQKNPGVLDMETVENLRARRIGIIVRKGNPLNIIGVDTLNREEVDLLDVKLEKMRPFHNVSSGEAYNVSRLAYTGQQGLSTWINSQELDAWITYKSWHSLISEHADFIEIPGDKALRHTPVALTSRTSYREEAKIFINFLQSEEARRIFAKHGWE